MRDLGVPARHDAAELLAHVLGTTRSRLALVELVAPSTIENYDGAGDPPRGNRQPPPDRVAWFRHVAPVGGVFVPGRDQCSPGGPWNRRATAASSSTCARVPVRSPRRSGQCQALTCTPSSWTRQRTPGPSLALAGTGVDLRHGDMATAFDDLAGTVDVVTCNPPYVPLEATGVRRAGRLDPTPWRSFRRRRARRDPRPRAVPRCSCGPVGFGTGADVRERSRPRSWRRRGAGPTSASHADLDPGALPDGQAGTMTAVMATWARQYPRAPPRAEEPSGGEPHPCNTQ